VTNHHRPYSIRLLARRRLAGTVFELRLSRPEGFAFRPGQCIRVHAGGRQRDYSLVSAPADPELVLCVAQVPGGPVSTALAGADTGSTVAVEGPFGHFVFRPSPRVPVFVATGTGVAPFVSMARAGIRSFVLLHGVRHPDHLYYRRELAAAACRYVGCLSADGLPPLGGGQECFSGRVTLFAATQLDAADYDFYVCGRAGMIRDILALIDTRFAGSLVFTETFY